MKAEISPTAVSGGGESSGGYCHLCHPDFEPLAGLTFCRNPVRRVQIGGRSMKVLKSGEKVRASGIYRVLHSTPHLADQREMYFEGSRLPDCALCPGGVLYRLESPCVPLGVPAVVELASAVS